MRNSAVLAAVLVLASGSGLSAQESATLEFAWPAGASAQVSVTSSTTATVMGQSTSMDGTLQYRLTAEADGEGFVLRYADYVFDAVGAAELVESGDPEDLTRVLSNTQSDIRIDGEGRFVGLEDYEATRASLDELLAPQREELEAQGMGGILEDFVSASLSEQAMTDAAEFQWNQMVGFWAGRTLSVGESVQVPSQMAFPIIANAPVDLQTELRLVGTVDCPEGADARRCLELASSSSPDAEELRNLMDVFMAEMSEQAGGMGIEIGVTSMDLRLESSLIVDAETLRPFRIRTTSDTSMELDAMGMPQSMDNAQTVVTVFDWGG